MLSDDPNKGADDPNPGHPPPPAPTPAPEPSKQPEPTKEAESSAAHGRVHIIGPGEVVITGSGSA